MCNPVAIAAVGLALSAVSTGYGYYAADQNKKVQERFNQESADEGSKLANQSMKEQSDAINERISQEQAAATQQKLVNAKKAAEARATVRVSAGEAGVSGLSVDALLQDYYRNEQTNANAIDSNLQMTTDQLSSSLKGVNAQAQDRVNSFKRPGINGPSGFASVVDFGKDSLDIYNRYKYDTTPPGQGSRG